MSPDLIAIVGMACLFPGAPNLDVYWHNILQRVDAVSDPPPEAWDTDVYYAPDSTDTDKVYCKRGGYLGSLATFDPLAHGIPPISVGGEPDQWLALQLARDALTDAGYSELPEQIRRRTAVVLGKGTYLNGGNAIAVEHGLVIGQTLELLKRLHPEYTEEHVQVLRQEMKKALPPMGAETVPGLIPNLVVGRIANRLDLMGPTYTVDAACASSLVAVQLAQRDLLAGECDLALVGGAQVWVPVPTLNVFCQLGALSRSQQIRPFDKDADGTLLGEGIGMIVLKRLRDAQRDADRIYAVIRGVGIASDGRGVAVLAPRIEGEELALRRAYAAADVAPDSVELVEAHGTGTPVGDVVEVHALTRVFGARNGQLLPRCALGSVKSMISHTMPAAGIASIIKTALALHHKVLPPTLHCDEPNPKLGLDDSPFYINTEVRPWVHGALTPRRAGVNAFGFGGINGHVVLEEDAQPTRPRAGLPDHAPAWDSEVFLIESGSRPALLDRIRALAAFVDTLVEGNAPEDASCTLADLAYSLNTKRTASRSVRLSLVATSLADLRQKLGRATERLADPSCTRIQDVSGIYFASQPLGVEGKLAFLFPGEGAQYRGMLADLCLHFPDARACFDGADRLLADHARGYVPSDYIFARPTFLEAERAWADARLTQMDEAIEAVLTANQAVYAIISGLGIRPDAVVGHSSGDYSALGAAGVLEVESGEQQAAFMRALTAARAGQPSSDAPQGAVLLAIGAARDVVDSIASEVNGDLHVAMDNCPHQTVLVGTRPAAERAVEILRREGLIYESLPFDRAYHTPLFGPHADRLRNVYVDMPIHRPRVPVYSCTTRTLLSDNSDEIRHVMGEHWVSPVEFSRTIESMYAAGVRVFVEAGPRGNLSAFVEDILRGRPHCAVPADTQRRAGILQLNHLVGLLAAHHIDLTPSYLYQRRNLRAIDWEGGSLFASQQAPAGRVSLAMSWPMLRLSEDIAQRVQTPKTPIPNPSQLPNAPPVHDIPLSSYLQTMDAFLSIQEQVVGAYLRPRTSQNGAPGHRYPLLGRIRSHTPGEHMVAVRTFDPSEDRYLLDHTLGRGVSLNDPSLRGLAVMPLAMSIEIVAEAAARLMEGMTVVGLRDVRADRWLTWDNEVRTLEVTARRLASNSAGHATVAVQLRELEPGSATVASPIVQATVLLADRFAPPASSTVVPGAGRASRWRSSEQVYAEAMFHGPAWQGVVRVNQTGPAGASATLRVLPWAALLGTVSRPEFELDPLVLDAAGQVVGLWASEQLASARVVFPFHLRGLDLYAPAHHIDEEIACTAAVRIVGDRQLRSDIDVVGADGKLWMRLSGWEDLRFDVPERFQQLILTSGQVRLSTSWPEATVGLAAEDVVESARVEPVLVSNRDFWKEVWAGCILGRSERQRFHNLRLPEQRQIEWLAARTAAKDALRELLSRHHDLRVLPADIEIGEGVRGGPIVSGHWLRSLAAQPVVSLTHSHGHAMAVASLTNTDRAGLGIDVEFFRDPPLSPDDVGMDVDEQREVQALPATLRDEWVLRCWCAKEAVGKALGDGLPDGAASMRVQGLDVSSGTISLRLAGTLAKNHPELSETPVLSRTYREHEFVVGTALCHTAIRSLEDART